LALSRLILRDAALWVLDEPTTALDQQGQAILMQMLIAHRAKGGIAVIASHHAFDLPGVQIFTMPEKKS
jgi:heme exporter protein A